MNKNGLQYKYYNDNYTVIHFFVFLEISYINLRKKENTI